MGGAAHLGMEAKTLLVDTAPRGRRRFLCGNGLQASVLSGPPGARGVTADQGPRVSPLSRTISFAPAPPWARWLHGAAPTWGRDRSRRPHRAPTCRRSRLAGAEPARCSAAGDRCAVRRCAPSDCGSSPRTCRWARRGGVRAVHRSSPARAGAGTLPGSRAAAARPSSRTWGCRCRSPSAPR